MTPNAIKARIQEAVKEAMRAQAKERLTVLRLIMSEFKSFEIDNQQRDGLDETQSLVILDKMEKQRKDSITQFQAASRQDLVDKEQFELEIIQSFKPPQLSETEIEQHIIDAMSGCEAKTMQDMGKVMAVLKPQLQGRADMAVVGTRVKALLANAKP